MCTYVCYQKVHIRIVESCRMLTIVKPIPIRYLQFDPRNSKVKISFEDKKKIFC